MLQMAQLDKLRGRSAATQIHHNGISVKSHQHVLRILLMLLLAIVNFAIELKAGNRCHLHLKSKHFSKD
jgi:hypothetical protein